jgi:SAM-dependent methyltransferase
MTPSNPFEMHHRASAVTARREPDESVDTSHLMTSSVNVDTRITRSATSLATRSSSQLRGFINPQNIIFLAVGLAMGRFLCSQPTLRYEGQRVGSSGSSWKESGWQKARHNEQGLSYSSSNSTNTRLLKAVYGESFADVIGMVRDLASMHPTLINDVEHVEASLVDFARRALKSLASEINFNAAMTSLSEPEPPCIEIFNASYGPKHNDALRADVKWILEPLVFNSVLRIPKATSLHPWFGSTPKGEDIHQQPYTLNIEGKTSSGYFSMSIEAVGGKLTSPLYISSALPTQMIPVKPDELRSILERITAGKNGVEIGGPSQSFRKAGDIYNISNNTDVVNFSEKTLWGNFPKGSTFKYKGGGSGTVYITEGSTLSGILDSTYDFVLGSHYLEHLINPLAALATMSRVTKPGGHVVLILPRKEACFDRPRGQNRIEEFLFRYLHKVNANDMRYANMNPWIFGNDLSLDAPAGDFYQLLARSIRFQHNKAIHVMVYDLKLLDELGRLLYFETVYQGVCENLDQWIILKKPEE